jgi:hypothetical protein
MPTFLADIPPHERLPFMLIACAIIFVFGVILYLYFLNNVWFIKRMAKHGQEALSYKSSEESYNKNVWKTKKTWSKAASIYTFVGLGLLGLWYYLQAAAPLLFGLSFVICGIVCFSHASMSEAELQAYLARKKNQHIMIARIFIIGTIAAYALWFLLPRTYFASFDILTIFAFISLLIAIAGTLDHFYTRARFTVE